MKSESFLTDFLVIRCSITVTFGMHNDIKPRTY